MESDIIKLIKNTNDEDIVNYLDNLLQNAYKNQTGDYKKDDALWSDVYDILFSHDYADDDSEEACMTFDVLLYKKYPDFEVPYSPNMTEKGAVVKFITGFKEYINRKESKNVENIFPTFDQFLKNKTINW